MQFLLFIVLGYLEPVLGMPGTRPDARGDTALPSAGMLAEMDGQEAGRRQPVNQSGLILRSSSAAGAINFPSLLKYCASRPRSRTGSYLVCAVSSPKPMIHSWISR